MAKKVEVLFWSCLVFGLICSVCFLVSALIFRAGPLLGRSLKLPVVPRENVETVLLGKDFYHAGDWKDCSGAPCTEYRSSNGSVHVLLWEGGIVGIGIDYLKGGEPWGKDVDLTLSVISELYGERVSDWVGKNISNVVKTGKDQKLGFGDGGYILMTKQVGEEYTPDVVVIMIKPG